jgi:DNA/RNA-binding domain of Phe-tRNA-synthetase-like protein
MGKSAPLRYLAVAFDVSPDVLSLGVKVVVLTIGAIHNKEKALEFDVLRNDFSRRVAGQLSPTLIKESKILQGFRDLHTAIGFSNRTFPAASESLMEYMLKNHHLPQINLLVDIYNLVSVETGLALGAHDLSRVTGDVHLRITSGQESYWPIGSAGPKEVRPGAYAYIDDNNDVICMLEVKQVEKTKVTIDTRECLFIIQGNAETDDAYLHEAAVRLINLIRYYCGGYARILYPDSFATSK